MRSRGPQGRRISGAAFVFWRILVIGCLGWALAGAMVQAQERPVTLEYARGVATLPPMLAGRIQEALEKGMATLEGAPRPGKIEVQGSRPVDLNGDGRQELVLWGQGYRRPEAGEPADSPPAPLSAFLVILSGAREGASLLLVDFPEFFCGKASFDDYTGRGLREVALHYGFGAHGWGVAVYGYLGGRLRRLILAGSGEGGGFLAREGGRWVVQQGQPAVVRWEFPHSDATFYYGVYQWKKDRYVLRPDPYLDALDLYSRNRVREALAKFERARRRIPRYPEVHYNIGLCLEKLGRKAEARRAFQQVLRLAPADSPLARGARGHLGK